MLRFSRCLFVALSPVLLLTGCGQESSTAVAPTPVPMVSTRTPYKETVQNYEYFTGRVESGDSVEIRAQVSGYLVKISFTPGTLVEKGAPLFEIDPRIYAVELEKADASHALAVAREKQMIAEFARMEDLFKKGSASQAEYDRALANKLEAAASVKGALAQIAGAKLNLDYTKINAPLTGLIGDKLVSVGNLIAGGTGNTTLLTTLVSVDPIDVEFDVDEATIQRFQEAERTGRIKVKKTGEFPVQIGLTLHGDEYPLAGVIHFSDNKFDAKTGTVKVKATVANPKPEKGERILKAGMFARVRVPIGDAAEAFLVPESALLSDQGLKYVYTIGADNKAMRLDIVPGVTIKGRVVVEQVREPGSDKPRALRPDERIIVSGVQRVRPGMVVDPKPAPGS